jgi:hypothetical protein
LSRPTEGDPCPVEGCEGTLELTKAEVCSCFVAPPCEACVAAPLRCDTCEHEPEIEEAFV